MASNAIYSQIAETFPDIKEEDILPEEDIHVMLREKGSKEVIAVYGCGCRQRAYRCDRPIYNCFEFGKYAEFNLSQSSVLKVIPVEEAIAISDDAERAGLLKSGGIPRRNGGVLSHCCDCRCNVMGPLYVPGPLMICVHPAAGVPE